jgi:hypothetical protein
MEILNRLSDENLTDLLLESDRQYLQPILEGLPEWARASADRPPEFWERQRRAILSRVSALEDQASLRIPRAAWAIAAAIFVIASFMLNSGPRVTPVPQAVTDADRELLLEVERVVQGGGPEALEPAALLASEIGQYQKPSSILPRSKGDNDEE